MTEDPRPAARQAVASTIVRLAADQGRWVNRPVWLGADRTIRDAEAMAGLAIARDIELVARTAARGYIRYAREDGRTWREIGEALGLGPNAKERGQDVAIAAFDYAVDPVGHHARTYGQNVTWTCGACGGDGQRPGTAERRAA